MEHTAIKYSKPLEARKISISILVVAVPVLYVFLLHIPLSTLVSDTTFWFLLANTIIVIVATDSGVFSASSGMTRDPYDEFIKHSRSRSSCLLSQPTMAIIPKEVFGEPETPQSLGQASQTEKTPSSKEEVKVSNNTAPSGAGVDNFRKKHSRNWSEGAVLNRAVIKEEKLHAQQRGIGNQKTLSRSMTESFDRRVEKNEYVNMSDDELNRRVEEFIKRFKEIRLQEMETNEL